MSSEPKSVHNRRWRFSIWYFVFAALTMMLAQDIVTRRHVAWLSYDEFKTLLKSGKVDDLTVTEGEVSGRFDGKDVGQLLTDKRREEIERLGPGEHRFVTVRVDDSNLVRDLEAARVRFSGRGESGVSRFLVSWVLPGILLFVIWSFLLKRVGAGAQGVLEIGKSKAKVYMETDIKVRFDDVAGVDEAKAELAEIVAFLRDPVAHGRLGARVPKGVLLVGPPGTGKTLLARAVAGEAGVPFFSINGPEFVEMFVGVGAARVRDLFEKARGRAPAIIFIDELDALGRARGSVPFGGGHDEKEQTLNQLLSELDGFDPSQGLVLLAATNRPEVLDPALLRAGRFDRQVLVDRPDRPGRRQILGLYLNKVKLGAGVDAEALAALTPGFTGADLANLVNEAALAATRRDAAAVEMSDFHLALERIVAGLEKRSRVLRPQEKRTVATHELGHAIVAMALPGTDPVQKISIIPRGIAGLGYTMQRPGEDRFVLSRAELEAKLAVLLGGRAAERLVLGDLSSGAADDLEKATALARTMVARFGMDDIVGHVSYAESSGFLGQATTLPLSPETAATIDRSVHTFVDAAYHRALAIVKQHQSTLVPWIDRLLAAETLEGAALTELHQEIAAARTPSPLPLSA